MLLGLTRLDVFVNIGEPHYEFVEIFFDHCNGYGACGVWGRRRQRLWAQPLCRRPPDYRSDHRELHDHPLYADLRADIIGQLVTARKAATPTVVKKVSLPDILPEDLMTRDTLRYFGRSGPRRRSELNVEEVSVAS